MAAEYMVHFAHICRILDFNIVTKCISQRTGIFPMVQPFFYRIMHVEKAHYFSFRASILIEGRPVQTIM